MSLRLLFSSITLCLLLAACAGEAPPAAATPEPEPEPVSKLMHCFAFTAIAEATDEDWQAFYTATDELPSKIPGLNHVTYGKLLTPRVGGAERDFGVCMEMTDEAAREVYGEHPAHDAWVEAYSKVRVPGTTTFDYLME